MEKTFVSVYMPLADYRLGKAAARSPAKRSACKSLRCDATAAAPYQLFVAVAATPY